jgi:hypothetical protein
MTIQNQDALPLLDKLIDSGIALKSGKSYYTFTRVGKIKLGSTAYEAEEVLSKSKIEKFITPEEFEARQEAKKASRSENLNHPGLATPSDKPSDIHKLETKKNTVESAFGELAASLQQFRPNDIDGEILDVFVFDEARRRWVCTKFTEDAFIKNLGVRFAWKATVKKIQNGENWSAGKGYHVASKKWAKRMIDGQEMSIIRVVRDDTPNEDFWTCGDQVLTVVEMVVFRENQRKKLLRANMNLPKIHATREMAVKDVTSKMGKGMNINEAFAGLAKENAADLQQAKNELSQSAKYSSNPAEVLQKLNQLEQLSETNFDEAVKGISGMTPTTNTNALSKF